MSTENPSYVASENIEPSRFVNILSGEPYQIERCDANDVAIGVTHEAVDNAYPGASSYAVHAGHSCRIYGMGNQCMIRAATTIAAGAYLKPDGDGKATPASSTNHYSAIALNDAEADELVHAQLRVGVMP